MNDLVMILLSFFGGTAIGALFFGGLWFTTKKVLTSKWPVSLYLGSLFIRIGFTLLGFYYIGQNDWKYMLFCLLGFISARFIVIRMTKTKEMELMKLEKKY
ncbi:ATP synthase subunit I [Cellulophaga sp. E16_2]|uniref:F1/F0 ATPase, Methanosarcina type, subunit 2 n=1 Tax=Cellulophaga algicola (strain DSM 14237 / IC166 / ACAM 630) TaxID=688270 RepID=E6XEF4_CELAD|nr:MULTISPECIES: ATP synthase subunit I [Cellulophaga]ADV50244.1 F1/F0 ATPase, Methanosarcina type, subunit 2 [Cellulophaga algicola DSM 14237]MBO0592645.1 ATP synthase subunit I [Cellulophaga sp. E16_2]